MNQYDIVNIGCDRMDINSVINYLNTSNKETEKTTKLFPK